MLFLLLFSTQSIPSSISPPHDVSISISFSSALQQSTIIAGYFSFRNKCRKNIFTPTLFSSMMFSQSLLKLLKSKRVHLHSNCCWKWELQEKSEMDFLCVQQATVSDKYFSCYVGSGLLLDYGLAKMNPYINMVVKNKVPFYCWKVAELSLLVVVLFVSSLCLGNEKKTGSISFLFIF